MASEEREDLQSDIDDAFPTTDVRNRTTAIISLRKGVVEGSDFSGTRLDRDEWDSLTKIEPEWTRALSE